MYEKFDSFIKNKTWGLLPIPSNNTILGGKWVFKLKEKPMRKITYFKAQ